MQRICDILNKIVFSAIFDLYWPKVRMKAYKTTFAHVRIYSINCPCRKFLSQGQTFEAYSSMAFVSQFTVINTA